MKSLTFPVAASAILATTQLEANLSSYSASFFEPFEHIHFSPLGTPIIHSFGIEPAFTGRDLFLDYSWREGTDVTEHEPEFEIEWAFTKRLGIIAEVPYIHEDEENASSAKGFGDLTITPRALLVEMDRFMLTAQIAASLPTGSSSFGQETSIAPGIALWNDLGNWFTLNSNLSVANNLDTNDTEFEFGFGLVKSLGEKPDLADHSDHHGHDHSASGLINLHLEITGSIPLNGSNQGDFESEGLIGISYGIIPEMDIRLGYQFPLSSPRSFDHGLTTGLIFHF